MMYSPMGVMAGVKDKEKNRSVKKFTGKDERVLGTIYRLYFRLGHFQIPDGEGGMNTVHDIVTGGAAGRQCDYQKLNVGFTVIKAIERDESGRMVDLSGLEDYARMASVLHRAEALSEKAKAEEEAKQAAEKLGEDIDTKSLNKKIEEIELNYFGGKAANGDRIYAKFNPVIQSLDITLEAEMAVVPLKEGVPDFDNARIYIMPLSKKRAEELGKIFKDNKYCDMEHDEFLEVEYKFTGASVDEAKRNVKFEGIASEHKLANLYPELWNKSGPDLLNRIGVDTNTQNAHNNSIVKAPTPNDVINAFRTYCSEHRIIFTAIDWEAPATAASAKIFLESGLVDGMTVPKQKFEALLKANNQEVGTDDVESAAQAAMENAAQYNTMAEQGNSGVTAVADAGVDFGDVDVDEL